MAASSSWQIVLIDDEEDIREVMNIALQDAGYEVYTAADGATGLQICEDISPQIVITDIRMPGMDGLQVLETVKKKYPDVEVIVATAFGEMNLAIRALQLDASDFITKPISDEALYLALKRARERFNSRKQLRDYTALLEKEKAETLQELLKSIAFQRNLIESSMDGIMGCDDRHTVVIYNLCMQEMLGFPKEEVLHKMTFDQFLPAGELARFKEELPGNGYGGKNRLILYETSLLDHSGRAIPVQVSATLLFNQDRQNGLVCFFRDLREIRKLEREVSDQARILHQDKMMSLGRLAASVVHEINNPLSGILNYLRLMSRILRQGDLSQDRKEKFQRYLDLVENETNRCSQIVSGLLSFSRMSPPSFGHVQIDALLQRCTLLSQHKLELSNIRLESSIQPDLPPVDGDFNQLQQCVINLIFNAIDAMPEGGKLWLNSRLDGNSGKVIITVRDSGRGISPEDLPHIFEPFFTTKNEGYGVGLGLSTVYGIMERHNGSVNVESQPGAGTAFMLELPVSGPVKKE
ncbi:MAG: response regulator [Deltaproteobacteria bacterium]|jgi:PAS domain S-box-containing protein|nr:response regulator [Deltaproteobacteria bacterium]